MDINSIFMEAIRNKYRFNFKGNITVEDLWDLSLTDLDSIFQHLNRELHTTQEESLLSEKSNQNTVLENKIAIIKHIVFTKKVESIKHVEERETAEKKKYIMSIIAEKKDADMKNKSVEELEAMLKSM